MANKKTLALIFLIFLIIGMIHGLISLSLNNFISWFLIGLWLIFALKLFENIKKHREFNSPHNTAFFVIIPLLFGIFYSLWGSYTGIFGENFISNSNLYFSTWSLIFGLPFVIYGSHSLYRCFKKYNVIYFGTKSVNARALGFILAFSVIFFIISYWIVFYNIAEFYNSPITPLRFSLDLNLLLLLIITIFNLFIFGFLGQQTNLPELSRDYIAQRARRIRSLTAPANQNSSARTRSRTNRTPTSTRTSRSSISRTQSSTSRPRAHTQTGKTKQRKVVRTTQKVRSAPKIKNFNKYRPKGSFISTEDFKCIFCFKLPKLPEDKNRGIVLCPHCRHPAHMDEFKDWMSTSNLCSRCSASISTSYRRNPRIISVKNYAIIYRHFLKKK